MRCAAENLPVPKSRASQVSASCYLRMMRIHHVFPYDPQHLGVNLEQWWRGQQLRWPLAAVRRSRYVSQTVVHTISRDARAAPCPPLTLRAHGTLYDNARWHHWGDDWSLSLALALRAALSDDVVVIHMDSYASAKLSLRFARNARRVIVLHGRGAGSSTDHSGAQRIVVLNDDTRNTMLSLGVSAQRLVRVVPSVDKETFHAATPTLVNKTPLLGYVGRLEESKGVFDLAAVLRRLSGLSVRLECIGSAPSHYDRCRADVLFRGLPVRFLGELMPDAVASRMRSWDVLLLPSYTEGMPLVALEALCCGIPVVGVDGVLPATLAARAGVFTTARSDFAAGVSRALETNAEVESDWIPDHSEGGRTWDVIYDSLGRDVSPDLPSLRPLIGRLRRLRLRPERREMG